MKIWLLCKNQGKGGNYVITGTHGAQGRQTFQTNFDFDSDFQDIRQQFNQVTKLKWGKIKKRILSFLTMEGVHSNKQSSKLAFKNQNQLN